MPNVQANHPLAAEWAIRAESARWLCRYVERFCQTSSSHKTNWSILDIGCGNGWLSRQLAEINRTTVIGVDINRWELAQAVRIFNDYTNLTFCYGDILSGLYRPQSFDLITLVAAIQYFPDLGRLLPALLNLLRPTGELHIVDSPFYTPASRPAAQARTKHHYDRLGFPEMTVFYHHHLLDTLQPYQPTTLHRPRRWVVKLYAKLGWPYPPFPWLRLRPSR